jgi:hypothetical protein
MVDEEPCLKSMMDLYDHLLSATVNDNRREPLWTSKTSTPAVPTLTAAQHFAKQGLLPGL